MVIKSPICFSRSFEYADEYNPASNEIAEGGFIHLCGDLEMLWQNSTNEKIEVQLFRQPKFRRYLRKFLFINLMLVYGNVGPILTVDETLHSRI
jgi:hypothetical protein